jgi:5-methylcytosine-specific restriction endonuclease McrA
MNAEESIEYGAGTLATCLVDYHLNKPPEIDFILGIEMDVNYEAYIKSPEWKELADQIKKEAGNKCRLCNSGGRLHVHHRSYDKLGKEGEIDDLIVLCESCHKKFHEENHV